MIPDTYIPTSPAVLERIKEENTRLQARVAELEGERDRLRLERDLACLNRGIDSDIVITVDDSGDVCAVGYPQQSGTTNTVFPEWWLEMQALSEVSSE